MTGIGTRQKTTAPQQFRPVTELLAPDGKSALTIAFNDRCDAIVATVLVGHDRPAVAEQVVVDFLNGDVVLKWAQVTLGL